MLHKTRRARQNRTKKGKPGAVFCIRCLLLFEGCEQLRFGELV